MSREETIQEEKAIWNVVINANNEPDDMETLEWAINTYKSHINACHGDNLTTALHEAVAENNSLSVTMLLKYGADVHAKDKTGRTPLFWAAFPSNTNMILILLDAGASPYEMDYHKRTCFNILGTYADSDPIETDLCREILGNVKNEKDLTKESLLPKPNRKENPSSDTRESKHPKHQAEIFRKKKFNLMELENAHVKKEYRQPVVLTNHGKEMKNPILDGLTPRQRLKALLNPLGINLYDCGSGGDCWFNSVADQINRYFWQYSVLPERKKMTGAMVRKDIYEFINKWQQENDFMYLEESDIDAIEEPASRRSQTNVAVEGSQLQQWIHDLGRNAWGNTYTNRMLPFLYNIPIRVWRSDPANVGFKNDVFIDFIPESYDWKRTDGFIEIANISNVHFQSVRPIRDMDGFVDESKRSRPKKSNDPNDNGMKLLENKNSHWGENNNSKFFKFK